MLRLRYFLEYIGLRFALFVIRTLSAKSAVKLAISCANMWYNFGSKRRKTTHNNIRQSQIATDDKEVDRIARASYQNFAILLVESIKAGDILTEENWQDHVKMEIDPSAMKLLKESKKGIILVSAHIGNWEIAAQFISFIRPVVGITKNMHNPYTDRMLRELKPKNRLKITPMHDTNSGRFLGMLKKGEVLAILIDQHAKGHKVMVDFFGKPVSIHHSAAMLHLITKTPLCFGYCIRTGLMQYTFKGLAPLKHEPTGNREKDTQAILRELTHNLEEAVKENPEQYLWAHRRWRGRPRRLDDPNYKKDNLNSARRKLRKNQNLAAK